jgi:hypothetical protein
MLIKSLKQDLNIHFTILKGIDRIVVKPFLDDGKATYSKIITKGASIRSNWFIKNPR